MARLALPPLRVLHPPDPGKFWKTPFYWEPGCPEPAPTSGLRFEPVATDWLVDAVAAVMASSIDESDQFAVAESGAVAAAIDLLTSAPEWFDIRPGWWRLARDADGQAVGFVLPVLMRGEKAMKDGKPQGTIYYMGVLPAFRGQGHAKHLLAEATRVFIDAGCWRIFCDASSRNQPMLQAFRSAGCAERAPWQRPVK